MRRCDTERLEDILAAIQAIRGHLARGDLSGGLVYDAVRARLIEIGEAVKNIDDALLSGAPEISWPEVAGMRDRLAHRYFDASHAIVQATVETDLPPLEVAVQRLISSRKAEP